jgi:hypothetical protein
MNHHKLFEALSSNLQKNQRQLRLLTLTALSKFEKLSYKQPIQEEPRQVSAAETFKG